MSLFTVAGASLFVLVELRPDLLLTDTTPTGGDIGAHVWGPAYLRDHLLADGRIAGWAPDWFAGFPYLTFYFPLPSVLVVLLDTVLPYNVAFKVVTVLGVVTLPVAAWAFGRLSGLQTPTPACLAAATLPFLFGSSFTIYGGNIDSTLAGQFAYSIGLSLALLFLGLLARGLETNHHRAGAAVLLALTVLTHIVPAFFALAGALVLTVLRRGAGAIVHGATVLAVGGLLAAFWAVPFVVRLPYTNDMGWEKIVDYRTALFPANSVWLFALALLGAVVAVRRGLRVGVFLATLAALAAAAFVLLPDGKLWNARLLPFWFLCLYLLAGLAVGELGRLAASRFGRERLGDVAVPIAALAAALVYVAMPLHVLPALGRTNTQDFGFLPYWVRWNYSGYEAKAAYPEYRAVVETMNELGRERGCGRALAEYEPELERFGATLALTLLPYWTDGCIASTEGVYFESSPTAPYHFLAESELSARPSRIQRDLPYRDLDVERGAEHLQLLGVRYYLAVSPEAQAQARTTATLRLIASTESFPVSYGGTVEARRWEVYEVDDAAPVAPLDHEPVVYAGGRLGQKAWLSRSVAWYEDESGWDVPVADGGPTSWPRVADDELAEPPRRRVRAATVSDIRLGDDRIAFDVDRLGAPVLVRMSYFPNWEAEGADGPWRVTPNFMVVVPTARHVELRYGSTAVDYVGWALTLLGVLALAAFGARTRLRATSGRRRTSSRESAR